MIKLLTYGVLVYGIFVLAVALYELRKSYREEIHVIDHIELKYVTMSPELFLVLNGYVNIVSEEDCPPHSGHCDCSGGGVGDKPEPEGEDGICLS